MFNCNTHIAVKLSLFSVKQTKQTMLAFYCGQTFIKEQSGSLGYNIKKNSEL